MARSSTAGMLKGSRLFLTVCCGINLIYPIVMDTSKTRWLPHQIQFANRIASLVNYGDRCIVLVLVGTTGTGLTAATALIPRFTDRRINIKVNSILAAYLTNFLIKEYGEDFKKRVTVNKPRSRRVNITLLG